MMPIARVLGLSLLTAGLGAWLGSALFGKSPDWTGISFVLGCIGAIVGAIAGATQGIVTALRRKSSTWEKPDIT